MKKKRILTDRQRRLVEDHLGLITFAIRLLGLDGFDSYEDAYQTGVIGLMDAAATYDEGKSSFSTYATHCIRNELRSTRRKTFTKRRVAHIVSLEMPVCVIEGEAISLIDLIPTDAPPVDKAIIEREALMKALEFLNAMPNDAVRITRMVAFGGKRQSDIADMLGYSQSYVSRMIRQVRKTLREQMEEAGYDPRPTA